MDNAAIEAQRIREKLVEMEWSDYDLVFNFDISKDTQSSGVILTILIDLIVGSSENPTYYAKTGDSWIVTNIKQDRLSYILTLKELKVTKEQLGKISDWVEGYAVEYQEQLDAERNDYLDSDWNR
jgi:hypothetical protein